MHETATPATLELTHFLLAYAGMLIHVLLKMGELRKIEHFSIRRYIIRHGYSMTASLITIPVLLIMATEPAIRDMLPLNYVTAVLAGWQTNSTFKAVMAFYAKQEEKS